ncbi:Citrate exporter 1 [Cladobotryum mycophilum]|uniref:Citrate exporter 1 n=1 Tax=Cladobotryum mycophilum TaxID=491253 RepID=A0ABR0SJ90_9HYPO
MASSPQKSHVDTTISAFPSSFPRSDTLDSKSTTTTIIDDSSSPSSPVKGPIVTTTVTDLEAGLTKEKTNTQNEEPYHIFSRSQKWHLDLHTSETLIALTITIYMIVQGIAPSLFGAVSDTGGRRITFAITLLIYTGANLALSFTTSYPMLMALRGIQALGSSATISISAGVIADIAAPSERGGFMGANAGIRMMGQAVGPIIGGALNQVWGFRSIFWLLFVMSLLVLVLLLIFLPETQRSVAGNGGVPLAGFYKPWAYYIRQPEQWAHTTAVPSAKLKPFSLKKCIDPLMYVFQKDIFVLLSWGALVYTLWSMVTSSTTTALLHDFPELSQWQLGLCFLPNGLGCVLGSIVTGRVMDREFKLIEQQYKDKHGLKTVNVKDHADFPFERARLATMPYFSGIFLVALALYGPSFELSNMHPNASANLAAPLVLQFVIAFMATAIFNMNSTMLVDCFPSGSAGATATNNLCRCLLGAVGVSVIQPMIDALNIRNAFLILTAVGVIFTPLVWVESKYGAQWRMQREEAKAEKSEK